MVEDGDVLERKIGTAPIAASLVDRHVVVAVDQAVTVAVLEFEKNFSVKSVQYIGLAAHSS